MVSSRLSLYTLLFGMSTCRGFAIGHCSLFSIFPWRRFVHMDFNPHVARDLFCQLVLIYRLAVGSIFEFVCLNFCLL